MGREIYEVQKTLSKAWGPINVAKVRATVEPFVTVGNEGLFRTYHPSLSGEENVFTMRESGHGRWIWIIRPTPASGTIWAHAGDREIHVEPCFKRSDPRRPQKCSRIIPDPIHKLINPRELLTDDDLDKVKALYRQAIGLNFLICGCALVLFKTEQDMSSMWDEGIPTTIGGSPVGYMVVNSEPSAAPLKLNHAVSSAPGSSRPASLMGLKIRLPNGIEAITTETHGFVKVVREKRHSFIGAADGYTKVKSALSKIRSTHNTPAGNNNNNNLSASGEQLENSPLGKPVYLTGANTMIGKISHTYDNPSSKLPYPAGYSHDLSLITSNASVLPDCLAPPGIEVANEWTNYEDALSGKPIFECMFNIGDQSWETIREKVTPENFHPAVIEGCQYLWNETALLRNKALLWRTVDERQIHEQPSNVLCLGTPYGGRVRPIAFHNYSHATQKWPGKPNLKKSKVENFMKVGFFLPEEIRESDIVLQLPAATQRQFGSYGGPELPRNPEELRKRLSLPF